MENESDLRMFFKTNGEKENETEKRRDDERDRDLLCINLAENIFQVLGEFQRGQICLFALLHTHICCFISCHYLEDI